MLHLIAGIDEAEARKLETQEAAGIDPTPEQIEEWRITGIKLCPFGGFPCDCFMLEPDQRCIQ